MADERWSHAFELVCWTAGVVLLLVATAFVGSGLWFQRVSGARFERQLASPSQSRRATALSVTEGEVIGRLEIPRLKLSVIVAEGDDTGTLRVAAGHLPDSPLPWNTGNSVLAAHRDSYFRPLQRIRHGDEVRMTTIRGTFVYKVQDASIVESDDLSVLDETPRDSLTLITCYPFSFVGTAPQRFVVRAERASEPTGASTSGARQASKRSHQVIRKQVASARVQR